MRRSFFILLSLFAVLNLSAQTTPTKFTETKVGYLAEITTMFETGGKEDEINFIYEFFAPKWREASTEDEKFIYEVSNLFLKKQFKHAPHFYQFLSSFYYFKDGKGGANFQKWKTIIKQLAEGKSKPALEKYMESVYFLLKDQQLYNSGTLTWTSSSAEFELVNDSIPAIHFKGDIALNVKSKGDYSNIYGTSGVYVPATYTWYGSKGKIDWQKGGLDPTKNFATFNTYSIGLNQAGFTIENATLQSEYYQQPLLGKVKEKIMMATPSTVEYPVFDSYTTDVKVENILPNIDYYGGFTLKGSRFGGIGQPGKPSRLVFKLNNKPFLESYSQEFLFDSAKVVAPLARVLIRLGRDSISHSGLKFRYDRKEGKVDMIKDQNSGSTGPMYSSFHELDFFVERITWINGDSLIDLGSLKGTASNIATFESNNYFTKERYKALQFPGSEHQLAVLRKYSTQNREKDFSVDDFAGFMQMDRDRAKEFLIDIANKGFLDYDFIAEHATLKEKLFDFLLANQKKIDYDVIIFNSEVKSSIQPNATLNIRNYDLNVYGVRQIIFSDSQAVSFFANKRTPYITVKKNRNIQFAGVLRAGGFDFYGDSFLFNYDKFKVDLQKVDSVTLYVSRNETDTNGKVSTRFVPVQTKIANVTGELYIDNPINKSGNDVVNNTEYPILKTNEDAYAYYDKPSTYDGVYNREKFFFKIDPFMMDSLDNFDQKALSFKGALTSAGIFPDIIDSLSVQDDYSLGFKHLTLSGGLPLYGDKASFSNLISLSDKGLMGNGDIVYVTSTSKSQRFTFFPDSTTGIVQTMENQAQTSNPDVPQVTGKDFDFKLDPVADQLTGKILRSRLDMFHGEAHQSGSFALTHKGLTGSGALEMFDGKLTSNKIRYNNSNAFADTASFELNSAGGKGLAISTDLVTAQIDFNYRVGTFKAISGEAKITFPRNRYVAFMDTYKWLVDEKKVELSNSLALADTTGDSGSRFISIHPDQDSLSFRVPRAIYDVTNYIIRCKEVKRILVADAIIAPKDGDVNILSDAIIETLQDATITADFINRFHTIFNATVEIASANKYLGRGNYNYEDDQKNQQKISFETISVDAERHTVAEGKIPEEANFKLNQFFDYRGKVVLKAQDKGLFFNGSTRILTNCDKIERNWLAFSGQVDPKDVLIPVGNEMKSDIGQPLGAGIMLQTTDSVLIYPTFISAKLNQGDTSITTALGNLWYNRQDATYNIGSKERFEKRGLNGNIVTLDTKTCDITANGALNFGTPLGQVKTSMVGNAKYSYKAETTQLNGLLMVDFFFPRKMLEYLSTKLVSYPFLQPLNISTTQFEKALTDFAPKEREDLMETLNKKGTLGDIPETMQKSLVFGDVKFDWDDQTASFVSTGNLGLLNTYDKPLMVYVKGKIQVLRSRRGNEIVIYFEFDPNTWYFFKYKMDDKPRMQFYSSDQDFMKMFEGIKEKDRKQDTKRNEPTYEFDMAPRTAKDAFFERFE